MNTDEDRERRKEEKTGRALIPEQPMTCRPPNTFALLVPCFHVSQLSASIRAIRGKNLFLPNSVVHASPKLTSFSSRSALRRNCMAIAARRSPITRVVTRSAIGLSHLAPREDRKNTR